MQGLSSNLVYNTDQTSNGRLWILTDIGVSSYDGNEITNYTDFEIKGVEQKVWRHLMSDGNDKVWLIDSEGKLYFIDQNLKLHYPWNEVDDKALNLVKDNDYNVFVFGKKGYYCLDERGGFMKKIFSFEKPIYNLPLQQITYNELDLILIPTFNQLIIFDAKEGIVTNRINASRLQSAILKDKNTVLVSTSNHNELLEYDINSGRLIRNIGFNLLKENPNWQTYFRKMIAIDKNRIAITSGYKGLFIYHIQQDSFSNYQHKPLDPSSLSSDNTFLISKGNQDNLLISTRTTGLNITNLRSYAASHVTGFIVKSEDQIFDGFIGGIAKDKNGQLWLPTQKGLYRYDMTSDKGELIRFDPNLDQPIGIRTVHVDSYGSVWVSISNEGIFKLNAQGDLIQKYNTEQANHFKTNSNFSNALYEEYGRYLHIASSNGINSINLKTGKVEHLTRFRNLVKKAITSIDKQGKKWMIGTFNNGVYLFEGGEKIHISSLDGIPSNRITDAILVKDKLYIGTQKGLSVGHIEGDKYKVDTTLFDHRILSLEVDNHDQIWMTIDDKLYLFNDTTISMFDSNHGFKGGGFRLRSSYYDKGENLMYYGCNKGFSYFNTDSLFNKAKKLNFWIQSISSGDSIYYFSEKDTLELPFTTNNLSVNYGNINILDQAKLNYQYKLNNDQWKTAYTFPLLLQDIQPGNYDFKMRVSNLEGNWAQSKNNVLIKITYPWWRQTWFYALLTGLMLFISYLIYKTLASISKVKKEKQSTEIALSHNQKKLSIIEMKALRSQMNPHFLFNSLNSINSFIIKNESENASDYLTSFAQLMRIILENSRHEWVSLENELKAVRLYIEMEELRFINQFTYKEEIDNHIDLKEILVPPMLIQPYCENAIWHGLLPRPEGHCNLTCKIALNGDILNIEIDDNGIGKIASQNRKSRFSTKKKSFGMKIIAERLQIINENYKLGTSITIIDKSLYDKDDQGTIVQIKMKQMLKSNMEKMNNLIKPNK